MPPKVKAKKRTRSEFQGPDDTTLRRAPGFELPSAPTAPKSDTILEKHTDYYRTSAGISSSTTLLQGPFSPDKRQRTQPHPDYDLTPLPSLDFDNHDSFLDAGSDYQPDHNGPAFLARDNLPKKHLLEEHLWASDIEDTDDEEPDIGSGGQGKAKAAGKVPRKKVNSVRRLFTSIPTHRIYGLFGLLTGQPSESVSLAQRHVPR